VVYVFVALFTHTTGLAAEHAGIAVAALAPDGASNGAPALMRAASVTREKDFRIHTSF
jgi:hypothetical protein